MAFRAPFSPPFSKPFPSAGSTPWYLSGGVALANCAAAYQPKGSASLAESYTNIANPGTYDITVGVAPAFDSAFGWTFTAGLTTYLKTGWLPSITQNSSVIVRFSNASVSTGYIIGMLDTPGGLILNPFRPSSQTRFQNGTTLKNGTSIAFAAGVMAIAGNTGYKDASVETTGIVGWSAGTIIRDTWIGAINNSGSPSNYFTGKVQAVAFYNIILTASQILEITTAMNLL